MMLVPVEVVGLGVAGAGVAAMGRTAGWAGRDVGEGPVAVFRGGIAMTVLQAGQATRLPASWSGALNFLEHFWHSTICGMARRSPAFNFIG